MREKIYKRRALIIALPTVLIAVGIHTFHYALPALAASTYSVNSVGDGADANPGDNVCETSTPGVCTLRAAIQEANAHAGADTINFGIAGSGVHTIQPASAYDAISDQVTINGYSQTGSSANTVVSPNPFNGTLAIEIDGQNAGGSTNGFFFNTGSDSSILRGLTINRFGGDGVNINAPNIIVAGNYIGTDSSGINDNGNVGRGIGGAGQSDGLTIGGLNPEDRNIISGNDTGGASPNTGDDNWLFQGNYIGLGKNGTTAIPNAIVGGSGAISVDNCSGTTIGGTAAGATNVISGNNSFGIAPVNSSGVTIQGNLIGTDYTGNAAVPNGGNGITISGTGSGALIGGTVEGSRNIVSGNNGAGIVVGQDGALVQGNYVGLAKNGAPLGNNSSFTFFSGIGIQGSNITIGGTAAAARNYISANSSAGIGIFAPGNISTNTTIQGNYIGTNTSGEVVNGYGNSGAGIMLTGKVQNTLVGGTANGAGNLVAGNGSGVLNVGITVFDNNLNNSFLGNSIYQNSGGVVSTIGIDLAETPDGSTFVNTGATPNDSGDPDTGTNHYMNFPVLSSVSSSNGQATITYSLDINDSEAGATGYRVEFFASDTASASGYGEGQYYIGADTVPGDVNNRTVTITLPSGISGNKVISAVTTMTDNSTDGFGHSSEFSANVAANLVAANSTSTTELANTGQNLTALLLISAALLLTGLLVLLHMVMNNLSNTKGI